MAITRRLPISNITRQKAINAARDKNSTTPPANTALTPATITRLNTFAPIYNTALISAATAKALLNNHTPTKDTAVESCRMLKISFRSLYPSILYNCLPW